MAAEKQTGAFLIALMEMPETVAAIARDVWGWIAALWQNHVATRPILWFLIAYVGVIATVIAWRDVKGSAFLAWEFWEGAKPQAGNAEDARNLTGGPEGIRNLVWSLATLFGGAAAVIGIILAARRTKAANHQAEAALKQSETAFQSLVTERFTRAVEQLGHEKRAVRLGAIYALERIAKDSARDRDTIVETLAAYIRENAPWPPRDKESGQPFAGDTLEAEKKRLGVRPPIDIAAALTVLCGLLLLPDGDAMRSNVDLRHTDLRGLDAPGINLSRMRLDQANLSQATLSGAVLTQTKMPKTNLSSALMNVAKLHGATLDGADLSGANLYWGILRGASLLEVNLSHAYLVDADLNNASLSKADLRSADLYASNVSNTDLSGTQNLTQEQIDSIQYRRGHPPRNLPAGLTLPEPYDP